MTSITIDGLRKTYGQFVAVDNLSLNIPAGTVFGLLGPNGSGKSTTFKSMLGLLRPSAGSIRFGDAPLTPALFEEIAFVPEVDTLYSWMTGTEHVEMNRRAFKKFSPSRATELLKQFGVDPRKKTRQLSKGMKTATMVALAFAREASVLILDEPTSGLDPLNQRAVLDLIIDASSRGTTVLFSSHQIGQVERAAERIAIIAHGRLVLEGNVDDLKSGRKVVEGIFPGTDYPLNGIVNDARLESVDRNGRILRLLTRTDSDYFARTLEGMGAAGVRVLDLNLEDIFLYAVSPTRINTGVVEGA